jgi:hypothetical protein
MLTVLNLRRAPQPKASGRMVKNRTLMAAHILFGVALLCVALLAQPRGDVPDGWYSVSTVEPGLL